MSSTPAKPYGPSAAVYDLLYTGASIVSFDAGAAEINRIIKVRNPGAASLLDVACGTGQHLSLLRDQYEVEGVDLSDEMLAVAGARLPDVPLHHGDMRSLDLGRRFDAVICMFSSIGHLLEPADMREAFVRMSLHLEPGGVLIVDGWVRPEGWKDGYLPELQQATDGRIEVYRLVHSRREGRITTLNHHYLLRDPDGIQHFLEEHTLALTPTADYVAAAKETGLEVEVLPDYMPERDRIVGVRPG
ncbi:MAG TPA: class I SAM-dependent methyltransferase [Candidatus Dormibacteraeota bacterium]|nr:class I SAM-dependent methyltransferase [Candidatus Dormibacteraeota bacterium]